MSCFLIKMQSHASTILCFNIAHRCRQLQKVDICTKHPEIAKPKVLVTHPETPVASIEFLSRTCHVTVCAGMPWPTREEILSKVAGTDGILWAFQNRLDEDVLNAAGPQLKTISLKTVGYDYVDLAAIRARGISIGNVPDVQNDAVAEMAVGLLIAAARRFQEGRSAIATNTWNLNGPKWLLGQGLKDSTVGIIGLGGIGQAIVRRLKGFGVAQFLYTGRTQKREGTELGAHFVSFDDLLSRSDFVVLACPLTKATTQLIDASALAKMKSSSVLVNIARGGVIDQDALVAALQQGTIFAAGLDVMTPEPLPADHVLLTLPNCVLMPHLASAIVQTREDVALFAAQNILQGLRGDRPICPL